MEQPLNRCFSTAVLYIPCQHAGLNAVGATLADSRYSAKTAAVCYSAWLPTARVVARVAAGC